MLHAQVRVWRVARTQQQIMANMRLAHISSDGLQDPDLVAYWQFNDPDKWVSLCLCMLSEQPASMCASRWSCCCAL